jgi:hypothetical protein
MSSQDAGQDWWLIMLVVAIFAAGVTIYVGWDQVGVFARKASLFLSSHF